MGVSHSMNDGQVDQVLTQFEATTSAIQGIDDKVSRVHSYVGEVKIHRARLAQQAEAATALVDSLCDSLNARSDDVLDYFQSSLDAFAGPVEELEFTFMDLGLQDAPRQMRREFGPLLVPAVVLVMVVSVSNSVFGFLLAYDERLGAIFSIEKLTGNTTFGEDVNILRLFAIFHVVLLGFAVLYLSSEALRRGLRRRRSRQAKGFKMTFVDSVYNDWLAVDDPESPRVADDDDVRRKVSRCSSARAHGRSGLRCCAAYQPSSGESAIMEGLEDRGIGHRSSNEPQAGALHRVFSGVIAQASGHSQEGGGLGMAPAHGGLGMAAAPRRRHAAQESGRSGTDDGLIRNDSRVSSQSRVTSEEASSQGLSVGEEAQIHTPNPSPTRGIHDGHYGDSGHWQAGSSETSEWAPEIGQVVRAVGSARIRAMDLSGTRKAWLLEPGAVAQVVDVDLDGDLRLINELGVESGWVCKSAFKLEAVDKRPTREGKDGQTSPTSRGEASFVSSPSKTMSRRRTRSGTMTSRRSPSRVVFAAGVEGEGSPSGLPVSQMLRRLQQVAQGTRQGQTKARAFSDGLKRASTLSRARLGGASEQRNDAQEACGDPAEAAG